jgi:transposase
LYKYGLNNLFIEIVLSVINKFKIETKYSHLDATSFHLHGEYKNEYNQEKELEIIKQKPIIITKGYSRDHRADLKQCVLDLITSSDGDIPLLMRAGDGNEADKAVFGKILVEFKKQINFDSIMVCDSALYSQEFFADSLFVENPERIETMLFLMSLCLLVYNLGQRELRNSLKRIKIGIKNQLGKLTISPTLRWVFQCFQGIHLLTLNGVNQIVNLTLERNFILNCLPSSCLKYYLLS